MPRVRKPLSVLATGIAGLTLLANAATAIDLSTEEKHKLYTSITALNLTGPPHDWEPEVGGKVPDDIKLYRIPSTLKIVQVIRYRYAVQNDTVVLADPLTREIVETITADDTKP